LWGIRNRGGHDCRDVLLGLGSGGLGHFADNFIVIDRSGVAKADIVILSKRDSSQNLHFQGTNGNSFL
jgi:hypothetical protein